MCVSQAQLGESRTQPRPLQTPTPDRTRQVVMVYHHPLEQGGPVGAVGDLSHHAPQAL